MQFYFAPLEGITGYMYRNSYNTFFPNVNKYFAPFIVPSTRGEFKNRDLTDILPENNQGLVLIPQLLTNQGKDFILASKKIKELGYKEINLNLGCPSGTVVSKNRGSGFLAKKEELDAFLDEIFSASITKISIKTRIGKDSPEEFYELIEIFNKYPLEELIIHPRVQKDFYKNHPNWKIFKDALSLSKNPICYNGDIFTEKDYKTFTEEFPGVDKIMLGRGLIANPGMLMEITEHKKLDMKLLKAFHDKIYEEYKRILFGDRNVLFKMKELWLYMITLFPDNAKYAKRIKKAERLRDYDEVVSSLFREREINELKS
jgi:tRNA-dihydrouridine synthase